MFLFCSHESRRPERNFSFGLLPSKLWYGPAESIGDALAKREYLVLGCWRRRHVAVLHPAVMARIVGYDYRLADLRRRLKCTKCGQKRVRIEGAVPGER